MNYVTVEKSEMELAGTLLLCVSGVGVLDSSGNACFLVLTSVLCCAWPVVYSFFFFGQRGLFFSNGLDMSGRKVVFCIIELHTNQIFILVHTNKEFNLLYINSIKIFYINI